VKRIHILIVANSHRGEALEWRGSRHLTLTYCAIFDFIRATADLPESVLLDGDRSGHEQERAIYVDLAG